MSDRQYINAQQLLEDSFELGLRILESGFRPDFIVGIWRGGTPIGLGVDTYFRFQGVRFHHTSVATSSYRGIGEQADVVVKGLEHVINSVCREDGLLIIDDVYESGRTIETIVRPLLERARREPDRPLVRDPSRTTTFRELADRAARIGAHLIRAGVRPGDRIGLCCAKPVPQMAAVYGISLAGPVPGRLAPPPRGRPFAEAGRGGRTALVSAGVQPVTRNHGHAFIAQGIGANTRTDDAVAAELLGVKRHIRRRPARSS